MSYPNGQRSGRGPPQNHGYSMSGNDFSDRTRSSQGFSSSGSRTQYMDASERTPYSQGSQTQGGYTQGGYTTLNDSHLQSQYSGGEYTERGGSFNNSGSTSNYTERGGSFNNSGSTSNYTERGGTFNNSGSTSNYTERGGTFNNSGSTSNYTSQYTNDGNNGVSNYGGGGSDMYSVHSKMSESSARRREESQVSSRFSQQNNSAQYDNSSVCPSTATGCTTVADGGWGRCPYQIQFQVQNQGKQMSSTKRSIYFRFGFANADALSRGKTGTECRGQEHDIVITWSITGGKRSIFMDGREIQYSAGKRANASRRADILEASWKLNDHLYQLSCYAYKPAAGSPEKRNPKWKQYNLVIDGRGFFELPQIFDLGLKGLMPQSNDNMPPSQVFPQSQGSVTSGMSFSQASHPTEVKMSIQSRIAAQRKLMKARKKGVSNEKRRNHSEHDQEQFVNSLSSDVQSMGLESGIFSAAPTELSDAKNRGEKIAAQAPKVALPSSNAPVPSNGVSDPPISQQHIHSTAPSELNDGANINNATPAFNTAQPQAFAALQNSNTHEARLTQYNGMPVNQSSSGVSGPPRPHHHQIQAQQNHSQSNPHTNQLQAVPPHHQYQTQSQQNQNQQPHATYPPQQYQIQAQQTQIAQQHRPELMQQQRNNNLRAAGHPPTQPNSQPNPHTNQLQVVPPPPQYQTQTQQNQNQQPQTTYPPQQYQIQAQQTQKAQQYHPELMHLQQTNAIQAAGPPTTQPNSTCDQAQQSSLVEFAPQQPPTYEDIIGAAYDGASSVADSSAVESAIVPRIAGAYDGHSEMEGSSIVPRATGAYDDNTIGDSIDSRDKHAPGLSTQQYPSRQAQSAETKASSSVDTKGINKFAYF